MSERIYEGRSMNFKHSVSDSPLCHELSDFTGGWLIGHFQPALIASDEIEVAVKHYRAGDHEPAHHHKIAVEYTVIASGRVRMNDQEYRAGTIIRIEPDRTTDFKALEDTVTVVLKTPSVPNDKFLDTKEPTALSDS